MNKNAQNFRRHIERQHNSLNSASSKTRWLALGLAAVTAAGCAEPIKVGVFKAGAGAKSVFDVLSKHEQMAPVLIERLSTIELLKFDVLYIGGGSLDLPEQIKSIKVFVACGGGLILNHVSCGRNRPQTLFPSIALKVSGLRDDSVLRVQETGHPLAANLPVEFEHAFNDHLYLEPGPEGHTILVDREGASVGLAGTVGAGRVVFNGALPGYWYDTVDYRQGEKAPEGPELQWVLNAIAWAAGEQRLSAVASDDVAARRTKAEADIQVEELRSYLPNDNWFGEEMLRGSYIAFPPVTEIGGRFFIFYDSMSWRGEGNVSGKNREFFRRRLKLDILQLKWLGITDIVYLMDMIGERVWHETTVPDSMEQYKGIDPLAELVQLATPEGINIWTAWHSGGRSKEFVEKYSARDAKGNFYFYGGKKRRHVEDLLNPEHFKRCCMMLDEYAEKYKTMGNFKGLFLYDEIWFNSSDFYGDDLPAIEKFCLENFGESLPADFAQKLEQRLKWRDPTDPWWRRYVLFRQKVMTDFMRNLVQHAHKRELQIGVPIVYLPKKWALGMDNVALSRLGGDFIIGVIGASPANGYPNSLQLTHAYNSFGHYTTRNLLGGPGVAFFTYHSLWRLIMLGNDPRHAQEFARHVYVMRMFANAQRLAQVAFLENQQALELLAPDPVLPWNRLETLFKTVQRNQDVRRIYSQANELYDNFRVLVATPFAGRGLTDEILNSFRAFLEKGGVLISIDCDWSSARADMLEERDQTKDIVGVVYGQAADPDSFDWNGRTISLDKTTPRRLATVADGTKILAAFSDGTPAVTEKSYGLGKVIGLHFDVGAELSKSEDSILEEAFNTLLKDQAKSPINVVGANVDVRSTLRKGNWVAIALYPSQPPTTVTVQVDTKALGIEKDMFRLIMLGKQMEISRPGDLWGRSGFWTPADLKAGFKVSLPEDNQSFMPLPDKFDLSDFKGKTGLADAEYLDKITREYWDSEKRGKRKRNYAHEVIVIAPADEPAMPSP